ncbi:MAG: tetratricopeptide repeat protein [bacterium]
MIKNKRTAFLLLLISLVFLFSSCSFGVIANDKDKAKEVEKKGIYMSDDEITAYMGYNAALYGGDINKAQQLLEQLVERHPEKMEFVSDLIGLYLYRKNVSAAQELIDRALKIEPENVNILTSLADIYTMKGNRKAAIQVLEKVLSIEKNKGNIPLVLANLYFQEKEFQRAAVLLEGYVKAQPDNFLAHIYLAKVYEELGKNNEAAAEYEAALMEREEDEIMIALDNVYDKLGDKKRSIEILERFLSRNPDYPKVRERLALLYLGINDYEKSLLNYEELLKKYPENKELKFKYVYIAVDGGFLDKARGPLEEILKTEPENQKALYFMGLLYKENKDWSKAIQYFEKVTDKEFEKSAKLYLSVCFEKLGDRVKAFSVLNDYWQKEKDSDIGCYIALYYKNKHDYENAQKMLKEIMEISEDKNKIILLLAEIHLKKNEFDKGIELAKEILNKTPDNPDALNFIGYSYVERNMNLDEAEKMIKRALELKPDDPYIMDSLAWLYYMKKEYTKALEIQKKVIEKIKDDATIFEHMGDILLAVGEKKEAKEYYKKALENEPENAEIIKKKIEELKD